MATTTARKPRTRKTPTPTTLSEWREVLAQTETGSDEQVAAMIGMRKAGASYSQMAEAMNVVPMTARARYLRVTGSK
jgi:hypothetical protein